MLLNPLCAVMLLVLGYRLWAVWPSPDAVLKYTAWLLVPAGLLISLLMPARDLAITPFFMNTMQFGHINNQGVTFLGLALTAVLLAYVRVIRRYRLLRRVNLRRTMSGEPMRTWHMPAWAAAMTSCLVAAGLYVAEFELFAWAVPAKSQVSPLAPDYHKFEIAYAGCFATIVLTIAWLAFGWIAVVWWQRRAIDRDRDRDDDRYTRFEDRLTRERARI